MNDVFIDAANEEEKNGGGGDIHCANCFWWFHCFFNVDGYFNTKETALAAAVTAVESRFFYENAARKKTNWVKVDCAF